MPLWSYLLPILYPMRFDSCSLMLQSRLRQRSVRQFGGTEMNTMIITQCAWCHKVKVSGRYTTFGPNVLVHEIDLPAKHGKTVHYLVSHGVCDPCKERLLGHPLALAA